MLGWLLAQAAKLAQRVGLATEPCRSGRAVRRDRRPGAGLGPMGGEAQVRRRAQSSSPVPQTNGTATPNGRRPTPRRQHSRQISDGVSQKPVTVASNGLTLSNVTRDRSWITAASSLLERRPWRPQAEAPLNFSCCGRRLNDCQTRRF